MQVPPEVASGRESFQGRRAPVDSWYVQEEEVELEVGDEDGGQGARILANGLRSGACADLQVGCRRSLSGVSSQWMWLT
jgi:hypothetical protein